MRKITATLIVEPKTLNSLALSEICEKVNIKVTGICSGSVRIKSLLQRTSPNLLIIDANKAETIHILQSTPRHIQKVVLSWYKEEEYILNLIRNNATSICFKKQKITEIALAINWTKEGKTYFAPEIIDILVKAHQGDITTEKNITNLKKSFSYREIQVLALLVKGYYNREIAENLHLKETTVKNYIEKIIVKLNCRNRTHAATTAVRLKIVN